MEMNSKWLASLLVFWINCGRNIKRFESDDFMFRLTKDEIAQVALRSQIVTLEIHLKSGDLEDSTRSRSQFATLNRSPFVMNSFIELSQNLRQFELINMLISASTTKMSPSSSTRPEHKIVAKRFGSLGKTSYLCTTIMLVATHTR